MIWSTHTARKMYISSINMNNAAGRAPNTVAQIREKYIESVGEIFQMQSAGVNFSGVNAKQTFKNSIVKLKNLKERLENFENAPITLTLGIKTAIQRFNEIVSGDEIVSGGRRSRRRSHRRSQKSQRTRSRR